MLRVTSAVIGHIQAMWSKIKNSTTFRTETIESGRLRRFRFYTLNTTIIVTLYTVLYLCLQHTVGTGTVQCTAYCRQRYSTVYSIL